MCLACFLLTAQALKVGYNVEFQPQKNVNMKKMETAILSVDFGGKRSIYKPTGSVFANELNRIFYKDFGKESFMEYQTMSYQLYGIKYSFNPKWILKNETKDIAGYSSKLAQLEYGGRLWNAWYTTEVPTPDGPYIFAGLPGLILQVSSADGQYSFTVNSVEKLNSIDFNQPKPTFVLSQTQFKDLTEKTRQDPAAQYRARMQQLSSQNMKVSTSFNGKEITDKDMITGMVEDFNNWQKTHDNPLVKGDIWVH